MTLQELDTNIVMANASKQILSIHHYNLFHPKPSAITNLALEANGEFLAITRQHVQNENIRQPPTTISVYRIMYDDFALKLLLNFIEHEQLTGIVWITRKVILTVSKEQTINLYNIKSGLKLTSTITDYGPILCAKYLGSESLLFTGTESGYVATYRINTSSIEPVDKMVKVNGNIKSLGLWVRPKKKLPKQSKLKNKPGKRKRTEVSDDSDSSRESPEVSDEPDVDLGITIYGACDGNVVVWDYNTKSIIERVVVSQEPSCNVLSLLVLDDGNIVTGDSAGTLRIYDQHTYTCKQTASVLAYGVLALAKDVSSKCILVSGEDPTIVVMKREKSECRDYVLFEKIELHTNDITAMAYIRKNEFITGSLDGLIARYRMGKLKKRSLEKMITLPHYSNHIKFYKDELMVQYDKEIVIWKLPREESNYVGNSNSVGNHKESNFVKLILLKSRTFIHSSTFNDRWICYSTHKDLHIFRRSTKRLLSYRPNIRLPDCSLTELCFDGNYLAACAQTTLFLVELREQQVQESVDKDLLKCQVLVERDLGSSVRSLISFKPKGMLVVQCGSLKSTIYTFSLNLDSEDLLQRVTKMSIKRHEISFITYNGADSDDPNIYAFTNRNQIIKFDPTSKISDEVKSRLDDNNNKVHGLPYNTCVLGMVIIAKDTCVLYDSNQMYKVDLNSNEVVKQNSDYRYIIGMNNFTFDNANHVSLVELAPADYTALLPHVKPKKKFGL